MSNFYIGTVINAGTLELHYSKTEKTGYKNITNFRDLLNQYPISSEYSKSQYKRIVPDNTAEKIDVEEDIYECLKYYTSLEECDFSGFNFNRLSGYAIDDLFSHCENLQVVKGLKLSVYQFVSPWKTPFNVTGKNGQTFTMIDCEFISTLDKIEYLFAGMSHSEIDISGLTLTMPNLTNINYMFNNDGNLTTIYAAQDIFTSNIKNYNNTFGGCTKLVGGEGTTFTDAGGKHAIIDNGTNGGYLTYKKPSARLEVIIEPSDAAIISYEEVDTNTWSFTLESLTPGYSYNYYFYDFNGVSTIPSKKPINQIILHTNPDYAYTVHFNFTGSKKPWGDNTGDKEGGDGDHDLTSDKIEPPLIPSEQIVDSGFVTLFQMTKEQLDTLYDALWQDGSDSLWEKLSEKISLAIANPADLIQSLMVFPTNPITGAPKEIKVAGWSSGVYATSISDQYRDISFGKLKINRFWNSFLDYAPYTNVTVYLPFIGEIDLNTNDVMGKELEVEYRVDFLNGKATASIYVDGSIMYQSSCNLSYTVPVTSGGRDYWDIASAVTNFAVSAGTTAMTGSPAAAAGMLTSANQALGSLAPELKHIGNVGDSAGFLAVNYPYVRITRPLTNIPSSYAHEKGYPCQKTCRLATLTGFTKVDSCHMDGFDKATTNELSEIETLLKGGVIL